MPANACEAAAFILPSLTMPADACEAAVVGVILAGDGDHALADRLDGCMLASMANYVPVL